MTSAVPGAPSRPVRWGFLGAGLIARMALAPAVHAAAGAELVAVAARDPARAAALEPTGAAYGDYAAVCDDPAVDVVYVALANDAHRPWTIRALAAGKHVLCEKPMGLTAGEVTAMAEAARAADRLLVEAAWNRWHPRNRRAESLVADGLLGADRDVEAVFTFAGVAADNYRLDPAMGGGALYDVGCYAVMGAAWLLGSAGAPLAVESAEAERAPSGVDLTTSATLRAPAGRARIRASLDEPERQVLRATAGRRALELGSPAFASLDEESTLRVVDDEGERVERFPPVDPYRLMVEAVSARVRGDDTAYVVPLAETLAVAATLDAIRGAA